MFLAAMRLLLFMPFGSRDTHSFASCFPYRNSEKAIADGYFYFSVLYPSIRYGRFLFFEKRILVNE
jgi:hypothetical protein